MELFKVGFIPVNLVDIIDVGIVASDNEDQENADEKENKIDWDVYTRKLENKYNKK